MANQKLTDKTLLSTNLASGDLLMVVDVSDTSSSAEGTSKKIANKHIIQTDIVTGNMDLATNPLTLVAAPGASAFIQPLTITVLYNYNSVASPTGGYMYISYDSTQTTQVLVSQRDWLKNDTGNRSYQYGCVGVNNPDGVYAGAITDRALVMYGLDVGGNGSFKVYVTYQIVTA